MKWESAGFLIASNLPIFWSRCSVWRVSFIRVTWLVFMCVVSRSYDVSHSYIWLAKYLAAGAVCDMTHSFMWHDSSLRHVCDMTRPFVWHTSFICVTCWYLAAGAACNMTHLYVWHDSSIRVTYIHTCDLPIPLSRRCLWHDFFICVIWLVHTWAICHSYVWLCCGCD